MNQYLRLFEVFFASGLQDFLPEWRFEMDPKVVDLVEKGQRVSAVEFERVSRTPRLDVPEARTDPRTL